MSSPTRMLLLLAPVFAVAVASSENTVTVPVGSGSVVGLNVTSIAGKRYYSFRRIPYAVPPVGSLRFQDPVPFVLNETVDATKISPFCTQELIAGITYGQEDCLYLNVYTQKLPQETDNIDAAVLVWIHGGSFKSGSGNDLMYAPDYIMEADDVILVTINYRLAAIGYLSTQDSIIPGNRGFKDQVLALQWVKENIAAFGGNPERVTIFGESAGSTSITYHLMSPKSSGLFQQAIAMSGCILNPRAIAAPARDRAFRFARALGYTGSDSSEDLLDFLNSLSGAELVQDDQRALSEEDKRRFDTLVFMGVIEPESETAFLSSRPEDVLLSGNVNAVPLLIGDLSGECIANVVSKGLTTNASVAQDLDENFEEIIGLDVRAPDAETQRQVAQKLRALYYQDKPITTESFNETEEMMSDLYFVEPVDYLVRILANQTVPVYYYHFSYKGPHAAYPQYSGVAHADELKYLFPSSAGEVDSDPASGEYQTRIRMVKMWTNFAKTGNPTPEPVNGTLWDIYGSNRNYLEIGEMLQMKSNLWGEKLDYLHELMPLQTTT
ncbi:cholinesterase 1-like [Schistocerca cancellata]|uniref:cholinesterase 1-like n=1 Tax=Schistocerca cancellata TaxID=274614 RepID=UPI002117BFE6|nr:cholinesterase 1-like [Schistocerca cancellata]